jgi:hypothetical protein
MKGGRLTGLSIDRVLERIRDRSLLGRRQADRMLGLPSSRRRFPQGFPSGPPESGESPFPGSVQLNAQQIREEALETCTGSSSRVLERTGTGSYLTDPSSRVAFSPKTSTSTP